MSLILQAIQSHDPESLALIGETERYTYGQLQRIIQDYAGLLKKVSVLGIVMDNCPEWVLWDLAAVKANIPCVPLPLFFSEQQKAHVLNQAGVSHLMTPEGLEELGILSDRNIPEQTAKITFTSGTTGTPKGVCLSLEGIEKVVVSLVETLGPDLAERHMCVLPLSILLENIAGVYASLFAGGTAYLPSLQTIGLANPFEPDLSKLTRVMTEQKITSMIFVPELLRAFLADNPACEELKFLAVGGAKVSPALIQEARTKGIPVYEGYGLSECASVVSLNTPHNDRVGSAGQILPHVELKVVEGELIIQNPAFLGYLGRGHVGAFATGDLGFIDDDGYLTIEGRKKDIIITSYGRNVSKEWVSSVLEAQPEIVGVTVYGEMKPHLSAEILPITQDVDIGAAVERANQELPEYARIKSFKVLSKENNHEFLQQAS